MKTFLEFLAEDQFQHNLPKVPFEKNPKIGWWNDHDHLTMYHGTHDSRVASIAKNGIQAGPNGWVSMTHDTGTAHGYASMSGGEANFRKGHAEHVPHENRSVVVAKIPKEWAEKHMDKHIRGNLDKERDKLINRSKYEEHKASGKSDSEYYQKTELRFPHIPHEFITGYMKNSQFNKKKT